MKEQQRSAHDFNVVISLRATELWVRMMITSVLSIYSPCSFADPKFELMSTSQRLAVVLVRRNWYEQED